MKIKKSLLKLTALFLIVFLSSCHNWFKDDDKEPELDYLVTYEIMRSYLPVMVETLFDQLVTTYPEMTEIKERVKNGLVVYRITYRTTFEGEPIIASGLVSVPIGNGTYPMISYQNGTNTLLDDAPSVNPDRALYVMLESLAATGFVVALPDYLGFGTTDNMFHPYLHTESTVPVIIDMLHAVEELGMVRDFSLNKDLYLTGYSLGGWATMQVQKELETNFPNEFNLKASAPCAGPYDLDYINDYIISQETYEMPYYMGFVYDSYANLGLISTPLDEIFNSPYDSLITVLYDGSLSGGEINDYLTTDMSELFTENFLTNANTDTIFSSITESLTANSVEAWDVTTPTHIVHSTGDNLVPFQVAQNMYEDLTGAGNNNQELKLIPLPGYSHTEAIVPAGLYSIQWFFDIMDE
jgi:pimeloyl-ACP methyl ester carboxylesterase